MTRDEFIAMVARLDKDGESVNGETFELENDDAVCTLHSLICLARRLEGLPEDRD